MSQPIEAPTPEALADLVARCDEINRYAERLTAAEESRIAALAAGIVVMRQVLELPPVPAEQLPMRQGRIDHWALTAPHLDAAATPAVQRLAPALLVLDAHEQVKVLARRSWRGAWRDVTLWRDGVHDLSAPDLMTYLARLTALAHQRAPDAARRLLERSQALHATDALRASGPRGPGAGRPSLP
jgi:hypothetical protein